MRTALFIFLALKWAALPAQGASPDFTVELFSNRTVVALTLEATEQLATVCGAKADGPCLELPPGEKISCLAGSGIRCHGNTADRRFAVLTFEAAAPLSLTPVLAAPGEIQPTFLVRSARINLASGRLQVTAPIDLESYVAGVLRGEASVLHAPAARQAMAILARTWAIRWQGRHRAAGFDFCSLTHCQVFRLPERGATNAEAGPGAAPIATRGRVLQYGGKLADPYFTANCGGTTEAAGNLWPDRAQPYLVSVHDLYCRASSHAFWTQELTSDRLQRVLRDALQLPMAAPLSELSVEKRDSSGRALVLRMVGGSSWKLDANEFRYAVDRRLGWEQIKSNLYTIERHGNSWSFSGRGFGHGVGLCQAGAEAMARLGFPAERILNNYFPGTETAVHTSEDSDPVASSEHFTLIYPSSQEPWVKQTLGTLEQWRRRLGGRAEVLPGAVKVQTFATVADFTRASSQPGWMAASSDGQTIALQPLQLLARKRILSDTVRHELTHLVVHRLRSEKAPRWFEEGMVLYLTDETIEAPHESVMSSTELEDAVVRPRSESGMKVAYAQALERVRRQARHGGEAALWRMLERPSADDLRWFQQ